MGRGSPASADTIASLTRPRGFGSRGCENTTTSYPPPATRIPAPRFPFVRDIATPPTSMFPARRGLLERVEGTIFELTQIDAVGNRNPHPTRRHSIGTASHRSQEELQLEKPTERREYVR